MGRAAGTMRNRGRGFGRRTALIGLLTFVAVFLFVFLVGTSREKEEDALAASLANFDPGYIISDYQMGNFRSMSEAEIQKFLTAKNSCANRDYDYYLRLSAGSSRKWHFENGHFVCLSEEKFGDGEVIGAGETAAHVIWQAAQDYRINPQVLIVLLQKETSLITDPIPNDLDYQRATGYGCPDHNDGKCSEKYYGFKNQVRNAAALFRTVLDGGWTNYPLGNNYVQYNPNADCGGSIVNIRSLATSALYRYTPYQPNAGALAAGYGTASCGAYGNRNFYLYFQDWFGGITDGSESLPKVAKELRDENRTKLGVEISKVYIEADGRVWQTFEKGTIIYHSDTGAHAVYNGVIHDTWAKAGGSLGKLGKPKSDMFEEADGRIWQTFEKGTVIYHKDTGAHAVYNGVIHDTWAKAGGSLGKLGKPKSDMFEEADGRIWQTFEKGTIIYHKDTGGYAVLNGPIHDTWAKAGGSLGSLGVPSGEVSENGKWSIQSFRNGWVAYEKNKSAMIFLDSAIYQAWKKAVVDEGLELGNFVSKVFYEADGRIWQTFEKGTIIYHKDTGGYAVLNGPIHDIWAKAGGSLGAYGRPIGNQVKQGNTVSQKFVGGVIKK